LELSAEIKGMTRIEGEFPQVLLVELDCHGHQSIWSPGRGICWHQPLLDWTI
jgi:hypothetical protein